MLAHAIDNLPSSTVVLLISGDRDFAYAMSILRLRCYNVVLCAPNNAHASLLAQASNCIDWASITVLPGNCMNFSKQLNEEPQRSISQGFMPPTSRFRGGMDYYPPVDDVGIIVNPSMRHAVKHSGGFSSDARGNSADFGKPGQDYTRKPSNNPMRYDSQHNSSAHSSVQDNRMPVPDININSACYTPRHGPIISDGAEDQESSSALNDTYAETSDLVTAMAIPLVVNASVEVRGASSLASRATPETSSSEAQLSSDSQMMYQLPVIAPLIVNQAQPIDSSLIHSESVEAEISPSLPQDTTNTTSTATPGTDQGVFVPPVEEKPPKSKYSFFSVSDLGATQSASSTSSAAYVAASSNSAPVSTGPAPARLTPPPQFKVLVRILQHHRTLGLFRPTRSQVALYVLQPCNGNPYKQAGVEKWAQYAELARKEGIIELGGREAAAWVALTPKWYDAHAT